MAHIKMRALAFLCLLLPVRLAIMLLESCTEKGKVDL